MVERLICNEKVVGSTPITSSNILIKYIMGIMKELLIKELIKDEEEEIDFVELSFELEEWIVGEVNSNL